jgi:hypothetical protein
VKGGEDDYSHRRIVNIPYLNTVEQVEVVEGREINIANHISSLPK